MVPDLPTNPLLLRSWLEVDAQDSRFSPHRLWRLRVDVDRAAAPELDVTEREVGQVSLVHIDLRRALLPPPASKPVAELKPALEFVDSIIADRSTGRLVDEAEEMIEPGPAGAVVVHSVTIQSRWCAHGLPLLLLVSALQRSAEAPGFARFALATTTTSPSGGRWFPGLRASERQGALAPALLKGAGLSLYRGVYIGALQDPQFRQYSTHILLGWLIEKLAAGVVDPRGR